MKKLFFLPIVIAFILLVVKFPVLAASPVGNYLVLNGGYVKTTSNNLSTPLIFNFSAIIYPETTSGKQIILSVGDKTAGKKYYEIGINGGSLFVDYGYGGFNALISASGLLEDTWQYISVAVSSSQTKLFINGTPITSPFITNNLGPIGPNIVLANSYKESIFDSKPFKGFIDDVYITSGVSDFLKWNLDESRGFITATDSSGNNLNGTLIGADNLIHFYGVLPSPTPFNLPIFGVPQIPQIRWNRPILPTLPNSNPAIPTPTSLPVPTGISPTPNSLENRILNRTTRPVFSGSITSGCLSQPGSVCAD